MPVTQILKRTKLDNSLEIVHDRRLMESSPSSECEFVTISFNGEALLAGPLAMSPNTDCTATPVAYLEIVSSSAMMPVETYKKAFETVQDMTGHEVLVSACYNEEVDPLGAANTKCIFNRASQAKGFGIN